MSKYRMSLDSGWESNAFEPFKEVEFKTADRKTIVYSKIVHGEWVEDIAYYDDNGCPCIVTRCSNCGEAYPTYNYCPNCGADMRGGTDGGDSI